MMHLWLFLGTIKSGNVGNGKTETFVFKLSCIYRSDSTNETLLTV